MYDIIIISGGFDPPHVGHFRMAMAASKLGKKVIVGVNSDEWLLRKKGYSFMPWSERSEMMSCVKGVSQAVAFDDSDNTATSLISNIRNQNPHISIAFANGGDRIDGNTPEKELCKNINVDMIWGVGGEKIQSSSDLVEASKSHSEVSLG